MSNPAKAYLTTQVETTTKGELLLMLYEAAIKFLKRAKIEMEKKDYAQKGIYISKAMDVISELANSLNKEKGGEITTNLHSLYMFCNIHLAKANIKMNPDMLDEVIRILDGIRSAYAQVVPAMEKGVVSPGVKGTEQPATPAAQAAPKPDIQPKAAPPVPEIPDPAQTAAPETETAHEQKVEPAKAAPTKGEAPASAKAVEDSAPQQQPAAEPASAPKAKPAAKPAPPNQPMAPKPMVNPMRLRANNAYANNR
jgi:flagellar protein FliS